MGGQMSTTPSENPKSSTSTATESASAGMRSPDSAKSHKQKPQQEPAHDSKTPETEVKAVESSDPPSEKIPEDLEVKQDNAGPEGNGEGEEGEEEGECGFCLFMKGGGCREVFIDWEKCVEEGEKNQEDIVQKCFEITSNLKKCMEAHADYYGPLLDAEKAAQEEARKELEKEKAIEESESKSESESDKDVVLPVSDQNKEEGS